MSQQPRWESVIKILRPSILSLLMCLLLLLQHSNASSATQYSLPTNIGAYPFEKCNKVSDKTYYCPSGVNVGTGNSLVITENVTLNVDGEFKVDDDSSVDKGIYVFNVSATKLHIDGPKSMIFDNLTATGKVHIHKKANLTANVTSTSGEIKIDGGNNTINGNITASSGYLNIDSNSNVNGTCIPSNDQCTPLPPMLNPTVASQTTSDNTPVVYGTYSSSVATSLNVTVNEVTYSLSTSSELTNSSDNWTLDLSSITPLPVEEYEVVATSADGSTSLSDNSSKELVIIEYSAEWWDTNWTKCRNITIANTGTTTLSNFPAYIDLPYDSDMQSNYNDIRFINTSCANGGLELDFEIETDTAASADVWVEIDNLPAAGTTIAVYYGNASAVSGENIPGTWESSHKGVWHLSEDTGDDNQDSTINLNVGTPHNSPASVQGKIGNALNFNSSDKTSVGVSAADSLELSSYDNWTISLWVKPYTFDNDYPVMYTYGDYRASVGLKKGSGKIQHYRDNKTKIHSVAKLIENNWQHVVVVYKNGGRTEFYINGTKNSDEVSKSITSDSKDSFIGGYSYLDKGQTKGYGPSDLEGLIDEVRVSKVARTPDWIKQSYDLVEDQGDHVTIGDEVEPVSEPSQCSAVFPDGASTHSASGTIHFGWNAQLIDSFNNQLATTSISKNTGSQINTCNTINCIATGTPSDTATTVNFQTTTSTEDVAVGSGDSVTVGSGTFSGNEFNDINPGNSQASITFSDTHSEYYVDKLILGEYSKLYLQAGSTYWINELKLYRHSEVIVQGTGTALVYVNQGFEFPYKGLINSPSSNNSGDASKLLMNVYGDVRLTSESTYTGSLYAQGDLSLISSSYVFGAVSAANINLGSESTITYQSGEVADTDFKSMCESLTPLLEYHFDELSWTGSANEVVDSSGYSHHSTAINATTTEAGKICGAGNFNGSTDYLEAASPVIASNEGPYTVSAWVYRTGTSSHKNHVIGNGGHSNSASGFTLQVHTDGGARYRTRNANQFRSINSGSVPTNAWVHMALRYDGSTLTSYLNGTLTGTDSSGGRAYGSMQNLRIGTSSNSKNSSRMFPGRIDEVLIFDTALSDDQINSIYTHQNAGNNYDGTARICPTSNVDHYRIEHDAQGFTCEAETVTIKACADADCYDLFTDETSISLTTSGGTGIDSGGFTGETFTNLNVTDAGTVTLVKTSASPDADLRCFHEKIETCDINFSDDGFEIYGVNNGDPLADQLAANNFQNVNLRAVRSNSDNNICEALLIGPQDINLTYDCDTPDKCITPLNGISIYEDGLGESSGSIEVEFDDQGVASLAMLNYPDAGRIKLKVQAEVDGVSINNSEIETVDVYPSYLQLTVAQNELLFGSSGEQNNYIAGDPFTFSIGAYGVNNQLLPNYQAETPLLKVTRVQPASSGANGNFKYADSGSSSAQLTASFSTAIGLSFSAGKHQYTSAYYDEVGRINIDIQDNTYLGNTISSNGSITLGDFYPAFFDVSLSTTPSLANTCGNFSYLGESIDFKTDPKFTITAYNALDGITFNYSNTFWNYRPDKQALDDNLTYADSSDYASKGTANVIDLGNAPLITNNNSYNGSGTVTITNGSFKYNKVDTNNSAFDPVSPFKASIDMVFASPFFTTSVAGQGGNHDICYKDNNSGPCKQKTIEKVSGGFIRYGRLILESTYGSEFEPLRVPIKAEYFKKDLWVLNTDDSNCTSIDFSQDNNELSLLPIGSQDISASINNISSTGQLLSGVAISSNDLLLNSPNEVGELILQLNPLASPSGWPRYLNYDWNSDTMINEDDFPSATVTFGQYRGNDKIIQWREVFN